MMIDVEVTADDIRLGPAGSCCCCPVALAFCRAIGIESEWSVIDVDREGIWLENRRLRRATPPLPSIARRFIADFDAHRPVVPIKFPVRLLTWAVQAYLND